MEQLFKIISPVQLTLINKAVQNIIFHLVDMDLLFNKAVLNVVWKFVSNEEGKFNKIMYI